MLTGSSWVSPTSKKNVRYLWGFSDVSYSVLVNTIEHHSEFDLGISLRLVVYLYLSFEEGPEFLFVLGMHTEHTNEDSVVNSEWTGQVFLLHFFFIV